MSEVDSVTTFPRQQQRAVGLNRLPIILDRIRAIRAELGRLTQRATAPPVTRPEASAFRSLLADAMSRADSNGSNNAQASARFDALIHEAAHRFGLSADLIHAVIRAESDYDLNCTSRAGAMGLMQLMPNTARALGVSDPYDPAQNIMGGARYLRAQLDRFGDLALALAAYNAGPGAVARHGSIPPYPETELYVRRVLTYLAERRGGL